MKKITLLIASFIAGVSTLEATYAEEIFTPDEISSGAIKPKELPKINTAVAGIMDFKTEGKTPAQIQSPLFKALVVENAINLEDKEIRLFLPQFLLSGTDNFKGLITHVTNNKSKSITFLQQFYTIFNTDKRHLDTLLMTEIYSCEQALASFVGQTLDTNEQDVMELATLELIQLKLLQNFLNDTRGSDKATQDCLEQLKLYSVQKATLLRRLTPFLIFAAVGGAAYVVQQHGDYIGQLAMDMFKKTGQFIVERTGYDIGALATGAASNIAEGTSAIAQSLWNRVPTAAAAKAMVAALPGMVASVEYKALAQSALDSAISKFSALPLWGQVGVGTGTAGAIVGGGYGLNKLRLRRNAAQMEQQKQQQQIAELTQFPQGPEFFYVNGVPIDLHEAKLLTGWYNWDAQQKEDFALSQGILPQLFTAWTPDAIQGDLMFLINRSMSSEGYPLGKKATLIYKNAYEKCKVESPNLLRYFRIFTPELLPNYADYEFMRINAPGVPSSVEQAHKFFQNYFLKSVGATEILPLSDDEKPEWLQHIKENLTQEEEAAPATLSKEDEEYLEQLDATMRPPAPKRDYSKAWKFAKDTIDYLHRH